MADLCHCCAGPLTADLVCVACGIYYERDGMKRAVVDGAVKMIPDERLRAVYPTNYGRSMDHVLPDGRKFTFDRHTHNFEPV